jgi:serine/threonine protein kinase
LFGLITHPPPSNSDLIDAHCRIVLELMHQTLLLLLLV